MTITIYHNPRCSKSRQTLQLLNDAGIEPTIVEYLKNPPSAATIRGLARTLGVPVAEILRSGEADYKETANKPALDDDAAVAALIADKPKLLQRPIVVNEDRQSAAIGRPPENVLGLLDQ